MPVDLLMDRMWSLYVCCVFVREKRGVKDLKLRMTQIFDRNICIQLEQVWGGVRDGEVAGDGIGFAHSFRWRC